MPEPSGRKPSVTTGQPLKLRRLQPLGGQPTQPRPAPRANHETSVRRLSPQPARQAQARPIATSHESAAVSVEVTAIPVEAVSAIESPTPDAWELPKRRRSRGWGYVIALVAILAFGFWWQGSRLEKLLQNSGIPKVRKIDFVVYRPITTSLATVLPDTYVFDARRGRVIMKLSTGKDGGEIEVAQQKRPDTLDDGSAEYRRYIDGLGQTNEVDTAIGKAYLVSDDKNDGGSVHGTIITADSLIEINCVNGVMSKAGWEMLLSSLKPMVVQ